MTYRPSITMTLLCAALATVLAGCEVGAVNPLHVDRATSTEVSGQYRTGEASLAFAIAIESGKSGASLSVSDAAAGELLALVNTDGVHLAVRVNGIDLDDAQADADARARLSDTLDSPRWAALTDLAAELEGMAADGSLDRDLADLMNGAVSATEAIAGAQASEPESYCCQRLFWSSSCDWDGRPGGCYYWGWLCDPEVCGGPF